MHLIFNKNQEILILHLNITYSTKGNFNKRRNLDKFRPNT